MRLLWTPASPRGPLLYLSPFLVMVNCMLLSRTKYRRNLKIIIENTDTQGKLNPLSDHVYTKNVVLKELLE